MRKLLILFVSIFLVEGAVLPPKINCADVDSTECAQIDLYRMMKSFFDRDSFALYGGFSLVKRPDVARTLSVSDAEIVDAVDDDARETALASYAVEAATDFVQGRSLEWDPAVMVDSVTTSARAVAGSLPTEFTEAVSELMTEGRSRRRKILKQLLPLLIGVKVKLVAVTVLAALGIALVAKKALLASLASLAITAFIFIKKLFAHKHHHHEHHGHEYHGGWSGGSVGYSNIGAFSSPVASYDSPGGWDASTSYSAAHANDAYGSHSSPAAHAIAFPGQKPKRR